MPPFVVQLLETWYNLSMKLTAKVKLQPTPEQHSVLLKTLERANVACNAISNSAWASQTFSQVGIHKLVYYDVREQFELSAQMTVRCIGKVVQAYRLDKKTRRTFQEHGAIAYDNRILSWYPDTRSVSIWTLNGREHMPFQAGKRQLELLEMQQGESDLGYIDGEFYLFSTCEIEAPEPIDVEGVLGVDLGIVNIATDSDGEQYSGGHLRNLRRHHGRLRKRLQSKGTKSAKRLLKKRNRKESRFAHDVNHVVSKHLVLKAKRTKRAIALEELKGIRSRIRARKPQRRELHSWSFHDLGQKILYKAELHGVPVVFVDPAYTSQTCCECGAIDKKSRKSQSVFHCVHCGALLHADANAARVIAGRVEVNLPHAGDKMLKAEVVDSVIATSLESTCEPTDLAVGS